MLGGRSDNLVSNGAAALGGAGASGPVPCTGVVRDPPGRREEAPVTSTTPTVGEQAWGELPDGRPVRRWVLAGGGTQAAVLDLGGILQSLRLPDRDGRSGEVCLGFDDAAGYAGPHPFLGTLIGRFANRIAYGRLPLNGRTYELATNHGLHHLHGGEDGFDKRFWAGETVQGPDAAGVRLTLVSPDGDQGYPVELAVTVTYTVDRAGALTLAYEAVSAEPAGGRDTVVNLTNHLYLNLAGAGSGTVEDHVLTVRAGRFTPIDATTALTGELAPVDGTPFDFRTPHPIGARLREAHPQLLHGQGYDHNWVLDDWEPGVVRLAARLEEHRTGRVVEVHTDQPGIQVYSGNLLDGTLAGAGGRVYRPGDAVCLETQHFPDSPNQPAFPSTVLPAGATFRTTTVLRPVIAP